MGKITEYVRFLNTNISSPSAYSYLDVTERVLEIKKEYKKSNSMKRPTKGIAVDCSVINGNPGNAEYRGLNLETGEILFEYKIKGICTNNIAEVAALVHGVNYLIENNIEGNVYTDSQTALAWYKNKRHKSTLSYYGDTKFAHALLERAMEKIPNGNHTSLVEKWRTDLHGEIPADFGRKK